MSDLAVPRLSVSSLPRGTGFARYVQALCRAKGDVMQAAEVAAQPAWRDTPSVGLALKAAINFGSTTNWGAEAVPDYRLLITEFIELLRPATVLGRLSGVHRVPFNVSVPRETQGATVGWVGQGAPKPVSELAFDSVTLGLSKVAGIVVLSNELTKASGGAAEALIRQSMVSQIAQFIDEQFLSPGVAAVANVSPASITNGLTPIASAGSSVTAIITDVTAMTSQLLSAGGKLTSPYLVVTPATALALASKRDTSGGAAFGAITVNGGNLLGLPVLVSNNLPHSVSGGASMILIDADGIMVADDGQATISVSTEGSLQMDSLPSNAAAQMFSLWQNNLSGILAERYINYKRRRDSGFVAYVDAVSY